MTRSDCVASQKDRALMKCYAVCVFCPFKDDHGWADLKNNDPTVEAAVGRQHLRDRTGLDASDFYISRGTIQVDFVPTIIRAKTFVLRMAR